jgi:hypothetical protein
MKLHRPLGEVYSPFKLTPLTLGAWSAAHALHYSTLVRNLYLPDRQNWRQGSVESKPFRRDILYSKTRTRNLHLLALFLKKVVENSGRPFQKPDFHFLAVAGRCVRSEHYRKRYGVHICLTLVIDHIENPSEN